MRILVVCQHYWPEPFNTADVCEALAARGHEVTVLTALPNAGMPGNDVPQEYRGRKVGEEVRNGVRVLRVKAHPRKHGAFHRIWNYLSFWMSGNRAARKLEEEYDVVLGYQFSPVMQVDPGGVYARKHGKKMLLYCFDLWPASLLVGGFAEGSVPFEWMRGVSRRIYAEADAIAVTSPLFDEYFRAELGLDIPDSIYLPQYAEDIFLKGSAALERGFDQEKLNLTFAGNVGKAQSVITIVEAAALLRDEEDVVFHIVGSGSALDECKDRAVELGLANVVFHGRKPLEDMPAYYAASAAMLATFADSPMAAYTLPRKVQSYLAAGKPVLAAVSGEARRVIDEAACGLCCELGDPQGLARIVKEFCMMRDKDALGNAARDYYLEHFTKDRFMDTLEKELEKLCA